MRFEEKQPTIMDVCILSPMVSKVPLVASPPVKKISHPGQKALLDLLKRRHQQYLLKTTQLSPKAKDKRSFSEDLKKDKGQGTLDFKMESSSLAQRVIDKAKVNIKSKRKGRQKKQSVADYCLCQTSNSHHLTNSSPDTNQSDLSPFKPHWSATLQSDLSPPKLHRFKKFSDHSSSPKLTGHSPGQNDIMKQTSQLYQSPLYLQVKREWRETLTRRQLPPVSKVRRALSFEKCLVENEHLISHNTVNTSQCDHDLLHHDDVMDDMRPSTKEHTYNATLSKQLPGGSISVKKLSRGKTKVVEILVDKESYNNDDHIAREREERKAKQEKALLKIRQRAEIYALNTVMRELEESNFKEALARKI